MLVYVPPFHRSVHSNYYYSATDDGYASHLVTKKIGKQRIHDHVRSEQILLKIVVLIFHVLLSNFEASEGQKITSEITRETELN